MIDGEGNEAGSVSDQDQKAPDEPGKEAKAEGKEEKVDFAAEVAKMRAENEELKTLVKGSAKRVEEAEGFVQTLTGKLSEIAARKDAAAAGDGVDPKERLRERISDDPGAVLDEHYQARTGPLIQRFLEQQGRTNRELFITKMSMSEEGKEVLNDYLEEVDDFLKDFEPAHRATPDSYNAALRWVLSKRENFEKEVSRRLKKEREKEKTHFAEPGTGSERGSKEQKRELSTIEKEVASGLGLTDDEYLKYKEA